jgi:histidyl-tRNA synthetase
MEYANRRGVGYVVIIGSNELEQGVATVKDMENGEQVTVAFENFVKELKEKFVMLNFEI